jgi:hypothetical protein
MTAKVNAGSAAIVPLKRGRSRTLEERKRHARARVSNGADILPNVDGRSLVARRYRDILSALIGDAGGAEQLSAVGLHLRRRFSATCALADDMEARLVNGEQIDVTQHALLVSSSVRLARQIGVARIPRTVGPTLGAILRHGIEQPS